VAEPVPEGNGKQGMEMEKHSGLESLQDALRITLSNFALEHISSNHRGIRR
jgi:hypothetical protein